jgi:chitinase
MLDVGSNAKYCNNGKYQSACCALDYPIGSSFKLYSKCEWPDSSDCDAQTCPANFINMDTTLALSASGNGGAICKDNRHHLQDHMPKQERKYCCDTSNKQETWKDCQWFDDVGSTPAGRSPDNYCHSGCPADRVRVALDTFGGDCQSKRGGRAYCCLPVYTTEEAVHVPENQVYIQKLQDFVTRKHTHHAVTTRAGKQIRRQCST